MSGTIWTAEQALSLAPDNLSARAAERLANSQEWAGVGRAGDLIWGVFLNPKGPPYHVCVALPELTLFCDCQGPKRPCRHALSLVLMQARAPKQFQEGAAPSWIGREMGDGSAQPRAEVRSAPLAEQSSDGRQVPAAPSLALPATLRAYAQRLAAVKRGMERLGRWLRDSVHGGLAGLPERPAAHWNEMAALLEEAHAPDTAAEIRRLRSIVGRDGAWPEETLRRMGRLYLLAQAFVSYKTLPAETQADLRGAVGWFADPLFPGEEVIDGHWLVMGATHHYQERQNVRRTWLYDLERQRYAQVNQPIRGKRNGPLLPNGMTVRAALRFAPSAWPLRAAIEGTVVETGMHEATDAGPTGYQSLWRARELYGKAISMNPWLPRLPLVLRQVEAFLDGEQWTLHDAEGYVLPLPHPFLYGWHVQVLNSVPGSALFGEWDGAAFTPLSVLYEGRWLALQVLRGQK